MDDSRAAELAHDMNGPLLADYWRMNSELVRSCLGENVDVESVVFAFGKTSRIAEAAATLAAGMSYTPADFDFFSLAARTFNVPPASSSV